MVTRPEYEAVLPLALNTPEVTVTVEDANKAVAKVAVPVPTMDKGILMGMLPPWVRVWIPDPTSRKAAVEVAAAFVQVRLSVTL